MQYIKNPSEAVQLEAVKNNGDAIEFIIKKGINPSEAVQLEAVKKNGTFIKYIIEAGIDPSEKVKALAGKESVTAFDNTAEAIQYLSDLTGSRVKIAGPKSRVVSALDLEALNNFVPQTINITINAERTGDDRYNLVIDVNGKKEHIFTETDGALEKQLGWALESICK